MNFERLDRIVNDGHHEVETEILYLISTHLEKQDNFYIMNKEMYDKKGPGFWLYIPKVKDARQAVYDGCNMSNLVYVPITDKVVKPHLKPSISNIRSIVREDPTYNPSERGIIMMYVSNPYSDTTTRRYIVRWSLLEKE